MQNLAANTHSKNGYIHTHVPMVIDGKPILRTSDTLKHHIFEGGTFQGAEISDCEEAAASCSRSFVDWSATSPIHRRALLLRLAEVNNSSQTNEIPAETSLPEPDQAPR